MVKIQLIEAMVSSDSPSCAARKARNCSTGFQFQKGLEFKTSWAKHGDGSPVSYGEFDTSRSDLDERFLESRRRSILREHQQLPGRPTNGCFWVDRR